MKKIALLITLAALSTATIAQKKKGKDQTEDKGPWNSGTFSALKFRNVGPALTAGRIVDIAVNPENHKEYYLAVASGGVWKTENAGVQFKPVFDSYGSYSTGCITIDPSNPHTVWLGTGENNNQRSVAYGDGVYKSLDNGQSWTNMGLKKSEHISKIIVHPANSDIVYVAAYGPLWSAGGDRGIYKTTDGGKTWKQILKVDEHTGFADMVMDPRDPNTIYASAHQRRRHVFTYVGGGPGSGLWKTTDGGKNWKEINKGLPGVDKGRIGLAISPVNPDLLYAIVEANDGNSGFYKSDNRGENWSKQSGRVTSGNYYQELYCDLKDVDKVYSMDTWFHHTEDGGKTWKQTGEENKHVDNHCMWQDPDDLDHWLVGCDGGLYETWDAASTWHFKPNLPITQFYKVAVDNAEPFYNIYGGTQDNNSLGGPSRTTNIAGILNSDWYITNGGDGFESQIDPKDPNIVYAQAQYGWLVRYDNQSGERVGIQPQPGKGEPALRWNWDAPLIISPHNHKRLYFAANKLFRSDDRGDSWTTISGDLSRQLDRNKLKVMGKIQSIDVVMKNKSTSIFGNIVALDESPKKENLIYVGTDDGLIQVTEDAGANWRKVSSVTGVPERTYVNMIRASLHDENVAFAVFNNHKNGDFKPYIYKTTDKGKTWTSITGNLPERGSVYAIAQDHVNKDLLFAGTEFGCFFTVDGGKKWIQLKAGLPTVAVRDIAIQRRENDLVLASFGRSFYVLDDYSPLRTATDEVFQKEAHIFPIKKSLMFVEKNPLGLRGVGSQGHGFYAAPNPEVGATFTYYMKEKYKKLKDIRQEKEKKIREEGGDVTYPSKNAIVAENLEEDPYLLFVIRNSAGEIVKKMKTGASKGMNRITWNFRTSTTSPVKLKTHEPGRYGMADDGYLVEPGTYNVALYKSIDGKLTELAAPVNFEVEALEHQTLPVVDKSAWQQFLADLSEIRRRVEGASTLHEETKKKVQHMERAVQLYAQAPLNLMEDIQKLKNSFKEIEDKLYGDRILSKYEFETAPSISDRIGIAVWQSWENLSAPTKSNIEGIKIAEEEFEPVLKQIHDNVEKVKALEKILDENQVPYTPGRGTDWKEE